MKEKIEFSEFLEIEKKLEIKVGTVVKVEDVPKSDKLLKLTVKFDEESQIVVTNIKPFLFDPNWMKNKEFLFVTNLNPTKIMGIESTAMILPGELENKRGVTVTGINGTKIL